MIEELIDHTSPYCIGPYARTPLIQNDGGRDGITMPDAIGDGLGDGRGVAEINQHGHFGNGYGDWGHAFVLLLCPNDALLEAIVINTVCRMRS